MTIYRCMAVAAFLTAAAGLAIAADAVAPAPPAQPLAIVGALIRTQTEAGDFVGTILIKDGKIEAIGPSVVIPADAQRIDGAGHVVTPGLIDARSVLWLNASSAQESGGNGGLNILDAVDPFADDWREAARQGVTAVYVQPGSGGTLGGNGAILRVGPATAAEELVVRNPAGVQATLGSIPAAAAPQNTQLNELFARFGIQPPVQQAAPQQSGSNSLTRYAQYESFRGLFDAAKKYGEAKPATKDIGKELLLRAIKRELPVRLETAHEDDVRNVLKLTTEFGVRLIFDRLDRVKTLPEEFTARKDSIVVGPFLGGKKSGEVRKLALDGRKFAVATYGDDPRTTSWLRAHAAAAVAEGYPRDRLLTALTRDAADIHGVTDKLGSIAAGRVADLVVFAGEPLDPATQVRLTISQGVVTYNAPKAEVAPIVATAKVNLPDPLPAIYVLKTKRLLNADGELAPGELFIENGRIQNLTARNSLFPVFDIGDAAITTGLVTAQVITNNDTAPDADAGHLRGFDGWLHDDPKSQALRNAGFLTAVLAPGSANVLAGKLDDLGSIDGCGFKFVLTSAARSNERYPASLVGQIELIRARLRGDSSTTDLYVPAAVRTTLLANRDKNLDETRKGKMPAYFEAQTRAEISAALALIAEFKLRGVILQPKQSDDLAEEIRAAGVGVVIGPLRSTDPEKSISGFVTLGKAGVPLAFGGSDGSEIRNTVACLVNAGMPRSASRRALTQQAGDKFGMLFSNPMAVGNVASFVIWDGDPIDPGVKPVRVVDPYGSIDFKFYKPNNIIAGGRGELKDADNKK